MDKIVAKNISKSYEEDNQVLKDFNYTFEKGKMYVIMGPSGAGKTTLLNILGSLENADAGSVLADDLEIGSLSGNEKAEFRMKHIGFIFQAFYLNPRISVLDNVIVPMLVNKEIQKKDRSSLAMEKLKAFGIDGYYKKSAKKLSGGEQQRVAIARAMANNPDVILADEPTGNLDEKNEKLVFEYLKKLAEEGRIVIVVSHNEFVKSFADEIIVINKEAS